MVSEPVSVRPFDWSEGKNFAEVRKVRNMDSRITGQWMMVDPKTLQQFFYEFRQTSSSRFRGRQSGVGPISDGLIDASGEISWTIDGVLCTGAIADNGRRIVKGVYKGGSVAGSFSGRRVSAQVGSQFPIGCWIQVLDNFKVYPNHRQMADDLGLANWVEGALPPEDEPLIVIGSMRHKVLKDCVMAVQNSHGLQYMVSSKGIAKATGPAHPVPVVSAKQPPPPPTYAASPLMVEDPGSDQ